MSSQTTEAAPGDPVSTPGLVFTLLRDAAGRQGLRACLSRLRDGGQSVAPRHTPHREEPEGRRGDPGNVGRSTFAGSPRFARDDAIAGNPGRQDLEIDLGSYVPPENPPQDPENIESAPEFVHLSPHSPSRDGRLSTPYARGEGWGGPHKGGEDCRRGSKRT